MCGFMGPIEPGLLTDTQLYSKSRSLGLGMQLSGRCIHLMWHLTLMTITKSKQRNKSRPHSKTTGNIFSIICLFLDFKHFNLTVVMRAARHRECSGHSSLQCLTLKINHQSFKQMSVAVKLSHCDLQFKTVCDCRMKIQTHNYTQT